MKKYLLLSIIIFVLFLLVYMPVNYFRQAFSPERKPKNYVSAKNSIYYQKKITHFPLSIPKKAKELVFYKYIDPIGLDGAMILEFTIDKEYINSELKNFELLNTDNKKVYEPYKRDIPVFIPEIKFTDFVYYPLKSEENIAVFDKKFPCYYGIAINKKENKIMYYYVEYD